MNTNDQILEPSPPNYSKIEKALNTTATFWFLATIIGQWLFVYYISVAYGGNAVQGNLEAWNDTSLKGHVSGDNIGNLVFAAHVLMAAIITFGGTLQLIPQIRARAKAFHRWNGRVFIITAFAMSLGGLYLIWFRESTTTLTGAIAITLNALVVMVFSGLTIGTARAGDIKAHRKWALRAFLAVSGVWFYRVGYMAWIILNQGSVGSTDNLDGPFDKILSFACFLLPLAILELYLCAQKSSGKWGKILMTVLLFVITLIMCVGIFGAYTFMWKPNL